MVKVIFTIIFAQIFYLCTNGQEKHLDNRVFLEASFSVDTTLMGDSLEVNLLFKNTSDSVFELNPEAVIGLMHNHKEFITYDTPQRISYKLHESSNTEKVIMLHSNGEYQYKFNIIADANFFYEGENSILVYYHFFESPKKRKCRKQKPKLSLWSAPIKVIIKTND